jgi:hypothetical protein
MRNEPDSPWLPRPLVWLKWGMLAAGVSVLWLALNYATLNEYFEARARRNEIKRTVQAMEQQYHTLQHERGELEMWGFAAEKAIRERLKMARPGEQVIIIDDTVTGADTGAGTSSPPEAAAIAESSE